MSREAAVLTTLVLYKAVLIGIGILAQRRTRDGVDYFLGGRKLGPLVAAVSASASSSSAWTLLGVSSAAYAWGLSALWIFPACVGGFILNWYVLAGPLQGISRTSGALTLSEVLAGPPNRPLHGTISAVASLIILVSLGTYVASQFLGAGKTFAETFDFSMQWSILIGGGIVVLYTLIGGFWAASLTDTVQGLLMAATALLLPIAALLEVGGPTGLWEGMAQVETEGYMSLTRNLPAAASVGLVLGFLGIGLGYPGQPHVVNRFMALREGGGVLESARRIAVGWSVIVFAGMLLLGLCGRVLFADLADQEVVFVATTNQLFPPVAAGIMVAAVLSAVMSTADSQLLVAASAVTHDLKLGGGSMSNLLRRSRIVVLLLSLGAMAGALFGSQEIFSSVLFAWTAMGAAFGPALVMTAFGRTVPPPRILAAMLLGFAAAVTAYAFPETRGTVVERVLPFAVGIAVILLPLRPALSSRRSSDSADQPS